MRAVEFLIIENKLLDADIDEGWRDWAAGAAIGAAALGGVQAKPMPTTAPAAKVQSAVQQSAPNVQAMTQTILRPEAKILIQTARAAGMRGKELAQFVAQCAHETGNFLHLKELGGNRYLAQYDPTVNPAKARSLGNTQSGDGAKYKGRGFIQITGKANYAQAGQALGLPLEQRPELVERPDVAAKVAVWYWQNRVAPKVSNFNDTAAVTKPINSGLKGLQDRHDKYAAIVQLMQPKA